MLLQYTALHLEIATFYNQRSGNERQSTFSNKFVEKRCCTFLLYF